MKEKQKQNSDEKFSAVSYPNELSYAKKEKRKKKQQKSDEKVLKLSFWKSDLVCLFFLVTFYNYPARSIVDKEKRKKKQYSDEKCSAVLIRTDPRKGSFLRVS